MERAESASIRCSIRTKSVGSEYFQLLKARLQREILAAIHIHQSESCSRMHCRSSEYASALASEQSPDKGMTIIVGAASAL